MRAYDTSKQWHLYLYLNPFISTQHYIISGMSHTPQITQEVMSKMDEQMKWKNVCIKEGGKEGRVQKTEQSHRWG